jgi:hypothetical protein
MASGLFAAMADRRRPAFMRFVKRPHPHPMSPRTSRQNMTSEVMTA